MWGQTETNVHHAWIILPMISSPGSITSWNSSTKVRFGLTAECIFVYCKSQSILSSEKRHTSPVRRFGWTLVYVPQIRSRNSSKKCNSQNLEQATLAVYWLRTLFMHAIQFSFPLTLKCQRNCSMWQTCRLNAGMLFMSM
jgi:hypothetical protein